MVNGDSNDYKKLERELAEAQTENTQLKNARRHYQKELTKLQQFHDTSMKLLHRELEEAQDIIMDLFRQGCLAKSGKYDHACMGIYEGTQEYLIKCGKIKPEECEFP